MNLLFAYTTKSPARGAFLRDLIGQVTPVNKKPRARGFFIAASSRKRHHLTL
jgi:hypothetical protein